MKPLLAEELVKSVIEGFVFELWKCKLFEALQGRHTSTDMLFEWALRIEEYFEFESFYLIQRSTWMSNGSKDMQSSNMA